jgi:hypothetical protein
MFDRDNQIDLEGVVQEFKFANCTPSSIWR